VLRGVADANPALAARIVAADVLVGTSAGASVTAQLTSEVPLETRLRSRPSGADPQLL
jgi:NTE family protein